MPIYYGGQTKFTPIHVSHLTDIIFEIVEKIEDPNREIILEQAKKIEANNKDLKVGDKIYEELPQIDFGRIAAQSAKQVISQRVKEAERTRQYNAFIDKQGQILSGIINQLWVS